MKLTRKDFLSSGIFGELEPEDESFQLFTLEHAYPNQADGIHSSIAYAPKLPNGEYKCVRGMHQLEGMAHPFETFEITNVPGHTNVLFHQGNTNKDSAGCVLLGLIRDGNLSILHSADAFKLFMQSLQGVDEFTLIVL